jgi:hypothetical protein
MEDNEGELRGITQCKFILECPLLMRGIAIALFHSCLLVQPKRQKVENNKKKIRLLSV